MHIDPNFHKKNILQQTHFTKKDLLLGIYGQELNYAACNNFQKRLLYVYVLIVVFVLHSFLKKVCKFRLKKKHETGTQILYSKVR